MPPKKPVNPKGNLIIHSNHLAPPPMKQNMLFVAFDPGEINFDVRIELRINNLMGGVHCTKIHTIAQARHIVEFQRQKIGKTKTTKAHYFQSIIDILNYYAPQLVGLDVVLIEGQMDINFHMSYLQASLITYFLIYYPNAFIGQLSSKLKGWNLGAPQGLTRTQLKRWTEDMAMTLAHRRDDQIYISYINSQTEGKKRSEYKIDDDADNYAQIEAFCVEVGYQLTPI
jgi:hypothetical protein